MRTRHRLGLPAALGGALLLVTSWGTTTDAAPDGANPSGEVPVYEHVDETDHGAVEAAREVAEPQLSLVGVDARGRVGMLDVLTAETRMLGEIAPPTALATDGHYLFATTGHGVAIVDSGRWTWNHGDHSHYYRAEPTLLDTVPGHGGARVATGPSSTAGGTGLYFAGRGEAVLLDNTALADGEVRELFRRDIGDEHGLLAPYAEGALLAADGRIRYLDADGDPVPGVATACADPAGSMSTVVGAVIGCADGAVLATGAGKPALERIAYPDGVEAPPATDFAGRKGRPTVAALAGDQGIWLLDTRERRWQHLDAGVPLARVAAVDDEHGHVVAVDRTGRVRVYAEGRGELAATAPLVHESLADPGLAGGVSLTVDRQRAYLNDPAAGVVHEIDYADSARVARSLETPTTSVYVAETGR